MCKNGSVFICMHSWVPERGFDQAIICQGLLLIKLESAAMIFLQILISSHLRPILSDTHSVTSKSPQNDI